MGTEAIIVSISASANDGYCDRSSSTPNLTADSVRCEYSATNGFLRFQLNVYPGASIGAALIEVRSYVAAGDDFDPRIYVEDVVNSAVFGASENLNSRTFWATYVTWNAGIWAINTNYDTTDFTALIQRIVDKATFAYGNYVTIKLDEAASSKGDDPRRIYSWDYDNTNATDYRAKLGINYTHACVAPAGAWVINATSGNCTMEQDEEKVGSLLIDAGYFLDINGFSLSFDDASHIYVKGSGSKLKMPSGSKVGLPNNT